MITPLGHRILIKQLKLEEVDKVYNAARKVGIVMPDHPDLNREQHAVSKGTVMGIGKTAFKDFGADWDIKVGDTVVFAKYAGKAVVDPDDQETYFVINDEDLVAKV